MTDSSEYNLGEFCATGRVNRSVRSLVAISRGRQSVLAYVVWNFGYRQGMTGSSVGKSIMKFKVVSEKNRPANRFRAFTSP